MDTFPGVLEKLQLRLAEGGPLSSIALHGGEELPGEEDQEALLKSYC